MGRNDPMHTTVCDRCYRGTWYESEGPCRMSRPTRCECCGQTTGEGPCGGTLRVIDRSSLAPAFAGYYESGQRVRVEFVSGIDGEVYETRTGTIGRTMGWRPSWMLMLRSDSQSSPYLLSERDRVVAVKRGSRYVAL